ncbi:MAG: class I SAM-dependent methyltransferase [Rhodobacterales bacterium]
MTGVSISHLHGLYAATDDPWNFAGSPYEQEKFRATRRALSRTRYAAAFELGCGNGHLARHLAGAVAHYTGMDAVNTALEAARKTLPAGTFVNGYYPCDLPEDSFDLVVLSEILYFLDHATLRTLAADIAARWPAAEIICVTYLGPSGNALQGDEALSAFIPALQTHRFTQVARAEGYRIDRGLPSRGQIAQRPPESPPENPPRR